jgi:methionyl-tRNA formyltransferase
MSKLRVAFLGTPDFAVASLEALAEAGHEIVCVYSQPPRPAGRGHRERPSPVHRFADERSWPVRTPLTLRDPDEQEAFGRLNLDVAVVVAYGLILPRAILEAPRLGCINVHASLLPRWRGAAPIQRALLAGDRETGVTIMQMDEGLDTGPTLLRRAVAIEKEDTAQTLHDRLAALGAEALVEALGALSRGALQPQPQEDSGATYAEKIRKEEGRLDWRLPARQLERQVRAFTPWPGAWFELEGERFKVLGAEVAEGEGAPGQVLDDELTIACGEGALRLTRLQRAGKAPMEAEALLRGFAIPPGIRLS